MAKNAPIDLVMELSTEEWDPSEVTGLVDLYAYQGFDPAVIQAEIVKRATAKNRDWKKDVRNMIILNVTRGNKLDKMMSKMTEEARKEVQTLRSVYNLKDTKPGAKDITLARVANVHGASTCSLLQLVAENLPVPLSFMNSLSPNYPVAMMHTSFGGLINDGLNDAQDIIDAHKLYLIEFSKVINRAGGKSVHDIEESFRIPLASAIASQFMRDEQKNAILTKLGIVGVNLTAAPGVKAAAQVYRQRKSG
ncbi:nucleoprotein [Silverwater virus]|uniref:Nucleoprotein n=1 Tax=Silverwater virus TaxID=1564099 RepID=A0A097SRW7_9VIRU|nr:nucleoprotein [Silverwater virus]AIU95030.1 nucleoprotein [Silverwater virus]